MGRTVYSPEYCLRYLEQCAGQQPWVIGLILGQVTNSRENVILLARTPEEKSDETQSETSYTSLYNEDVDISIMDISEAWVADHAKHVTRMLPGGMFVQGIFLTSYEDGLIDKPNVFNKIKSIMNHIHKLLNTTSHMYGNCPSDNNRLILHMSDSTKTMTCKSVEIGASNRNIAAKPVDWKFLSKPQQWQRLDCYYEFDDIYPVIVKNSGISVKQQFQQILESAYKTVEASVMFIDGELRQTTEALDDLVKKRKMKSSSKVSQQSDGLKSMHVSLFVPFENVLPDTVEYLECDGSIHFSGVVSSSVFMYPKATINEAIAAVKQDIVRSLASRFTMHCDALIDDNLLPEEKVCFNEPPRRVLVPVGSLYLCDYLFPGEAPAEALLSVKELLDLQITEADVVCDVETPADTSEFDALDRDGSSEELLATPQEASQFMYITGICFAMFVLIISIVIHYYDTIVKVIGKLL